jgi:cyanophycinase-like exopeptidase
MQRALIFLCSWLVCASFAAAQGRLVAIPEAEPSAELMQAVRVALDLKSEPLRLHLGDSAPEGAVLLDTNDYAWLSDRDLAARMAASEALVLSGGSFLDWYDALLADGRRMVFTAGIFDALRRGTDLIGYGGACAFLSRGTSIQDAELARRPDSRSRNPRRRSEQRAVFGLGLGPPGYIDAAAFDQGSPARLMRALDETHIDLGWWIAPDTALLYDYPSSSVFVVGPGHAVVLDLRRARRQRGGTCGARLSVLTAGDGWFPPRRRLLIPRGTRTPGTRIDGTKGTAAERSAADRWIADFLPETPREFSGSLKADADTLWTGPDDAPRPLRLRLDWRHTIRGEAAGAESPDFPAGDAARPR